MPGLLAAEIIALELHLLEDVPVADLRRLEVEARLLAEADKAQIRHDRADDRILFELAARLHIRRADGHHEVAVDEVALVVDRKAAVRVAVERDARVEVVFLDVGHQRLHVGRAAVVVDVDAVGVVREHMALGAKFGKELFGRAGGRAVRAVDRNLHAGQRKRDGALNVVDIIAHDVRRGRDGADIAAGRRGRGQLFVEDDRLNLFFQSIGQLIAVAGKDLDAVKLAGVVAGGQHDAGVGLIFADQERDGRRGHDAEAHDVRADAAKAGGQGALEHIGG